MPFSMTGYGEAEGAVAGGVLRVELRTVNHRYFNLAARLPAELATFETELRDRLRKEFERGQVSVSVRWVTPPAPGGHAGGVDRAGALAARARLEELGRVAGLGKAEVTLDLLARQPEVFLHAGSAVAEPAWSELEPIVAGAARQCREARAREGEALARELGLLLDELTRLGGAVEAQAPGRLVRERDRLRAAVAELLERRPVDEARLHQELALLAERLDIREEVVRLRAHLEACRAALGSAGPVGKQLGFLAQELGREVNTIGSKANDAAMQHLAVAMKGALERFREQLENLE